MPLSAVQPERYSELLDTKASRVATLLAPFAAPPPAIYPSPPQGFRMRAEFRMWHDGDGLDYVMFRKDAPKTPVPITAFPIACDRIQQLMPALLERLRSNLELRKKLFQVEFLSTLAGETLITLIYHRQLEEAWQAAAATLRDELQEAHPGLSIIGRARKQKLILGRDWVLERLEIDGQQYSYRQHEQAFTQPNAHVNVNMIEWARAQARKLEGDLLELYCGNGNFTLPLACHFKRVLATELAKISVRAARDNLADNGIANVEIVRLSAEEVTQALAGEREFRRLGELSTPLAEYDLRTVFVDPPRAGLDEATLGMVSTFETILYISCNPDTLAQNLETLSRSHRIDCFALFDQFPYTEHMECGVLLRRR